MKKIIIIALLLCICLGICACSNAPQETQACIHQYEGKITQEPSCTAYGVKTFTCKLCHESYTEEIPVTEHTYTTKVTKESTCTEDGEKTTVCSECGDKQYLSTTKLGHTTQKGVCERCYRPVSLSADEIQKLFQIQGMEVHEPNSAGGCSLWFCFNNTSDKVIKYITCTVSAYNGVKDPVSCTIRGQHTVTLRGTGPYAAGESDGGTWKNVWYNDNIRYYKLEEVVIEYMDGTFLIIDAENVEKAFGPSYEFYGKNNHI